MSIFATPQKNIDPDLKILYLHGLDGSPNGKKAELLKKNWSAFCPPIRTNDLRSLREDYSSIPWQNIPQDKKDAAMKQSIADAKDAINYIKPDVIIGSSMGGSILFRLAKEGFLEPNVSCVFLAPAVYEFSDDVVLQKDL